MKIAYIATITGLLMSLGHPIAAWKIYRSQSTEGISLASLTLFFFGTTIWTYYGWSLSDPVIITSFSLGAIGSGLALSLTLYYRYAK